MNFRLESLPFSLLLLYIFPFMDQTNISVLQLHQGAMCTETMRHSLYSILSRDRKGGTKMSWSEPKLLQTPGNLLHSSTLHCPKIYDQNDARWKTCVVKCGLWMLWKYLSKSVFQISQVISLMTQLLLLGLLTVMVRCREFSWEM